MFVYVGVFPTRDAGLAAVRELRAAGLPAERVGILTKQEPDTNTFGLKSDPTHTQWEEGTAIGAVTGGLTGVGLGLAVATGLIPALGPVIAGGMFVSLLASAGAGATVGTMVGGLIGLGIPEDAANYYDAQITAGSTVVAVQTEGPAPWVPDLFKKHGAVERSDLLPKQSEARRND
jgi:hypothetical protein